MERDDDPALGVNRIEGYLLWTAERDEARRRARLFTDRLPWLTTAQREEVEREYTQERLEMSRAYVTRVAGRIAEIDADYRARYGQLKVRCVAVCAAAATAVTALSGAAYLTGG